MAKLDIRVGIDIDNVTCNTTEAVLAHYNEKFNDNLKVDDIKDYYIEQFVKPEAREIIPRYFEDKEMWKRVHVINQKAIQWLIDNTHVWWVTSTQCINIPKKESFLKRNFQNIDVSDRLIRATNKQMLMFDYAIDDYHKNLKGGAYQPVCIAYPWNEGKISDRFRYKSIADWIAEYFGVVIEDEVTKDYEMYKNNMSMERK